MTADPVPILSVAQMYRADALAAESGVAGATLMAAAGAAVAREIRRRFAPCPVLVLAGPGNNGGDGFVAARALHRRGWPVRVALLGEPGALRGDAAYARDRWKGPVVPLSPAALGRAELVIDALFGAGLSRPLHGVAAETLTAVRDLGIPLVAVDVPSGLPGDGGAAAGTVVAAALTVTFHCLKPAHVLLPGRALCGEIAVADIGIPEAAVEDEIAPEIFVNAPALWLDDFPRPRLDGHKYDRGHLVMIGGGRMTGAARLAARAARRAGAGLVTIACPPEAFAVYAADAPGTMVDACTGPGALAAFLDDPRLGVVVAGPGLGRDEAARARLLVALGAGKAMVLDADALTLFADEPRTLFEGIAGGDEGEGGPCVLTPHEGEFARLFADLPVTANKIERTRAAARASGAVVLLKGADTVVAAPDGRAAVNVNGPPWLATAGSGDVLAGLIGGLLAQGMPAFEAAAAGAWLHGEAALAFGPALVAEDLIETLPAVLAEALAINLDAD